MIMNNKRYGRLMLGGLLLLNMPACSTIKSWFPDKERDYQFTTEIPELVVPDDLKAKTLGSRPTAVAAETPAPPVPRQAEKVTATDEDRPIADKPAKSEPIETQAPAASGHGVQTTAASGVSSLQIDQSANQAWWIVGKALSRQKLEVVERNVDKGYFFVKYDPDAIKPEDDSILDEINFLFGDDPSQEQEYRVSLHELEAQLTEVTVQDSDGKTLSNAAATSLLRLITDGINQELPKNSAENPESAADKPVAP